VEDILDKFAHAKLARAATALNRGSALPALVLMTDDERLPDPLAAAAALPRGSMVVVRTRQASHRAKLARALAPIARARRLTLLVANDAPLAARMRAHGLHLSEARAREAAHWRALRPRWLITAAAHSLEACVAARRAGADAAFLAPVFATSSHPNRPGLGALRARTIARQARLPVYALGGIDSLRALQLARGPFAGLAAIAALKA
jgi:thiamine-phosphate pyrophosphorylase